MTPHGVVRIEAATSSTAEITFGLGLALAGAVRRSSHRDEGLRSIAKVIEAETGTPCAAWAVDPGERQARFLDARGLDVRTRHRLQRETAGWAGDRAAWLGTLTANLGGLDATLLDLWFGVVVVGAPCADADRVSAELTELLATLPEPPSAGQATSPVRSFERLRFEELSPRERQVLALIVTGASTRVVAEGLSISAKTVKTHVQNILSKLGVGSRLEAVAFVTRNGFTLPTAS
jgi:DNA-binding CsgD family transcriptional regulator